MLELCAEKKIKAMTEVMQHVCSHAPLHRFTACYVMAECFCKVMLMDSNSASAALDRVAKNLPRYRIVLKKA